MIVFFFRRSDVGLEGSVYFVCQRAETGIRGMKLVGPIILVWQRPSQIDMPYVGGSCQSPEHRVQRIYEFRDYIVIARSSPCGMIKSLRR